MSLEEKLADALMRMEPMAGRVNVGLRKFEFDFLREYADADSRPLSELVRVIVLDWTEGKVYRSSREGVDETVRKEAWRRTRGISHLKLIKAEEEGE